MPPTQDSQGLGSCSPRRPVSSHTQPGPRFQQGEATSLSENPQGIRGGWGKSPWASLPAPLPRPTPVGAGVRTGGRPCSAHPGGSQCHQSQVHGNIMDRFCSPGPPNAGSVCGGWGAGTPRAQSTLVHCPTRHPCLRGGVLAGSMATPFQNPAPR